MKKMQLAIVGMVLLPMAAAAKTVAYGPLVRVNANNLNLYYSNTSGTSQLTDTDFLQFSKEKANAKIASDVLLQTSFDPFETPDELKINTDLIYGFNDAGSGSPLYRRSGYTHPDRVEDAKGKWLAWENGRERNYYCLSNLTDNTNKKFMPVLWYPEDMSYQDENFCLAQRRSGWAGGGFSQCRPAGSTEGSRTSSSVS